MLGPGAASTHGVTTAPGETFSKLSTFSGTSFGGIQGPDATLKGDLQLGGMTNQEICDSQNLQLAIRRTIASSSSTTTATVLESQVALDDPCQTSSRRLLNTATAAVTYTITLTPEQASSASSTASQIATVLLNSNQQFVQDLKTEANALGALTTAMSQFLTASGATPTVTLGTSMFSFRVTDTSGPTVVGFSPMNGETHASPETDILLTFSEPIQAGTGYLTLTHSGGGVRKINVQSTDATVSGTMARFSLDYQLAVGTTTVTLDYGAITDDAEVGFNTTNPNTGITGNTYTFTVAAPPPPPKPDFITIGPAAGTSDGCVYMMTDPYYTCQDFTECIVFLKQMNHNCPDDKNVRSIFRKVTLSALQEIARVGQERNGGDGRDLPLTFGGGRVWPEYGTSGFETNI
jgi:hypothetical protein